MFWKKEKVISIAGFEVRESMIKEDIVQERIDEKLSELIKEGNDILRKKPLTMKQVRRSMRELDEIEKNFYALKKHYRHSYTSFNLNYF